MIRYALLVLALGCSTLPAARARPTGGVMSSADEVRWPPDRRVFAGTIQHDGRIAMLALADSIQPALIALGAGDDTSALADGTRVALSGIGRPCDPHESAAGATIALRDIRVATDGEHGALRTRTDLEVEIRKTRIVAEGTLVARPSPRGPSLLLELAAGVHVPVMVTVDGVADAEARVGARVRLSAYLMPTPDELRPPSPDVVPGLAIGQPVFE